MNYTHTCTLLYIILNVIYAAVYYHHNRNIFEKRNQEIQKEKTYANCFIYLYIYTYIHIYTIN